MSISYTDGKNIYFVHALLGNNKFAVCKRQIGADTISVHKYKSPINKVVETKEEAQEILNYLAQEKNLQKYVEE